MTLPESTIENYVINHAEGGRDVLVVTVGRAQDPLRCCPSLIFASLSMIGRDEPHQVSGNPCELHWKGQR